MTPDELKHWEKCFRIAFAECVKQLGHRKAPACIDDARELADLAVEARRKSEFA